MTFEKLKVLDLFSGISGFSYALDKTGYYETVAFCEIDKDCHKVLNKHWPEVPIFEDVSTLTLKEMESKNLPKIDVLCGGFPCQDISVAGKQKGLKDNEGNNTRSGLWFEYSRLINELKPRYVFIENVANLRSNGLVRVLQDLWTLGYDAEWHIISARDIGACHLRERIWIIAYPCSFGRSERASEELRREIEEKYRAQPTNVGSKKDTGTSSTDVKTSNSDSEGLEGQRKPSRVQKKLPTTNGNTNVTPNTDDLRLWKPFASEKAKQEWWAETSASQRDWWKIESPICRVDDDVSSKFHTPERVRKQRIKQLGNSIVPGIVEIIGDQVMRNDSWKYL